MNQDRIKAAIECGAWLAFAGFLFYFSLGFRDTTYPGGYALGAVFWVDLVIILIVLSALANGAIRFLASPVASGEAAADDAPTEEPGGNALQIVAIFLLPLIFVWLLPRIGFYFAMPLFVFSALVVLGERRLKMLLGLTAVICGILFFVFTTLLYVPLPTGRIELFYEMNTAIRVFLR